MTKSIILVKINYCMSFKELKIDKVTSWPQLISKLLVAPACLHAASDWSCTFLHPRCFCLAYILPKNMKIF